MRKLTLIYIKKKIACLLTLTNGQKNIASINGRKSHDLSRKSSTERIFLEK